MFTVRESGKEWSKHWYYIKRDELFGGKVRTVLVSGPFTGLECREVLKRYKSKFPNEKYYMGTR